VCMVVCLCVGSVMDWQPIQDVPCLWPDGSWSRLIHNSELDKLMDRWMDGWVLNTILHSTQLANCSVESSELLFPDSF